MSQLADMHMSEQETDLLVQLKEPLCRLEDDRSLSQLEYVNLSAPVSALPNEILITIFEMGYPYGLHIKASHDCPSPPPVPPTKQLPFRVRPPSWHILYRLWTNIISPG